MDFSHKKERKPLFTAVCGFGRTDGIEGASPSHLLRKSPIVCPSRSAEANRARRTVGSILFEKET